MVARAVAGGGAQKCAAVVVAYYWSPFIDGIRALIREIV
jgi:hypothetical protein